MLKAMICLVVSFMIGVVLLELRGQATNLSYQTNRLHNQIEASQGMLWNQQLQIAVFTAPNAITKTVGQQQLSMQPRAPLPAKAANWLGADTADDAE